VFSCKQRGLCPSCGTKRGILFGEHLHKNVLLPVPHRHLVFILPKRIRPFFLRDRSLHKILFHSAWQSLKSSHKEPSHFSEPRCGAVKSLHTSGETLNHHPHIHAVVSDGVFDEADGFHPVLWECKTLTQRFQTYVMQRLIAKFPDRQDFVDFYEQIQEQEHTGFNVWIGDPIAGDDIEARMFIGKYLMRHPFSLSHIKVVNNSITITSSKNELREWCGTALDFLARLSVVLPNPNERLERCFGRYSSRVRGRLNAQEALLALAEQKQDHSNADTPRKSCATWARCIKMNYEVDPLQCQHCGGQMKIIAFIRNSNEIPKIMTSFGLPLYRAPPLLPSELQNDVQLFYDDFSA
jgi:hypothetical protein